MTLRELLEKGQALIAKTPEVADFPVVNSKWEDDDGGGGEVDMVIVLRGRVILS